MYDSVNTEQAIHEIISDLSAVKERVKNAPVPFESGSISRVQKTATFGDLPNYFVEKEIVYIIDSASSAYFTDGDDDRCHAATYLPADNQEELLRAVNLVTEYFRYSRKDPLKGKVQKYLDWDENSPVGLPTNTEIVHTFKGNQTVYQSGNAYFISETWHGNTKYYKLFSTGAEGCIHIMAAIQAAIKESIQKDAAILARRKLSRLKITTGKM